MEYKAVHKDGYFGIVQRDAERMCERRHFAPRAFEFQASLRGLLAVRFHERRLAREDIISKDETPKKNEAKQTSPIFTKVFA